MEVTITLKLFGHYYFRELDEQYKIPVVCKPFVEEHTGTWPIGPIKEVDLVLSDEPFKDCFEGEIFNMHRGHATVFPGDFVHSRCSVYPELARQISIVLWKSFDFLHPIKSVKQMWNYWFGVANKFYWKINITSKRQ